MVEWRDRFGKKGGTMKKGYIYKINCLLNDKVYIGQTTKTIKQRFEQHYLEATKFNRENQLYIDMVEYGKNNFEIIVLEEIQNEDYYDLKIKLNDREIYFINKYNSLKNGYNISKGNYKDRKIKKQKRLNFVLDFEKYNKIIDNLEKNNFKSLTEFIETSCIEYKKENNQELLNKKLELLNEKLELLEYENRELKYRNNYLNKIIIWDRLPLFQKIITEHPIFERGNNDNT